MSRDIRSFFQTKKPAAQPKKPAIDDDDDVIPESPDVQLKYKKKESRKRAILDDSDDDEIFSTKKKKPSPSKKESSSKQNNHKTDKPALKEVKVIDLFGGPIKRTEPLVKKDKFKKKTETGIHSDDEFEKSLLEVDVSEENDSNNEQSVTTLAETKTMKNEKLPTKVLKLKFSSKDTIEKIHSKPSTSKEHKDRSESKKDTEKSVSKEKSMTKVNGDSKESTQKVSSRDTIEKMHSKPSTSKEHKDRSDSKKDTEKSVCKEKSMTKVNGDSKDSTDKVSSKDTIEKMHSKPSTSKEHKDKSESKKDTEKSVCKEKSTAKVNGDSKECTEKVTSKPSSSHSNKEHEMSESKRDKRNDGDSTKERSKDRHHSDSKISTAHLNGHSKHEESKIEEKHSNKTKESSSKVNGETVSVGNDKKHRDSTSKHENHEKERDSNKTPTKESKREREKETEKSPTNETKAIEKGKNDKKRDFSEFLEDSVVDLDQTKTKKKKMDKSLNESALTDEERFERKRHSAALYQQYLNRSGPKHLGAKEIPEGTPNCLANCAFLLTGVLDSFEREEIANAVASYGGCVKSSMSKKVTHVLAGEDAGPAKMAKAQELGIPIIGEDDFIKIILENSGKSNKTSNKLEVKKETDKKSTKEKQAEIEVKKESSKEKVNAESSKEIIKIKDEVKSKSCSAIKSTETKKIIEIKEETKSKSSSTIEVAPLVNQESSKESIVGVGASNTLMWVDKYKPQTIKQIIGQHGDASNVKKLINWLTKWYVSRKAKLPKPNPWAKGDDGGYYKAVLLSGPPGVGKTTAVSLVCKELGFDAVEFNASDTRNKNLIREQIGELLTTNSLSGYAKGDTGKQAVTKKHVLVMDEVDGMAGNEDRGGMQELINLIKSTSVPIICMCNDRSTQKMRSLTNYCYELRFARPRVEQIKSAMMSICCKEGIKIPPDALTQLIVAANQDVRQTLNLLSLWAVDSNLTDAERLKKDAKGVKKDIKLGPWEAVRKVFSEEDHKTMSINDKSDLFFYDYSMAPLFVQENYLQVTPHCPKNEILDRVSQAADSISAGDLVDARIRRNQAWSLLPTQAMYASVIPGHVLSGHVSGQIQFPGWLGKNSRATKMHRLCQEIHAHTRLSTSGSKSSIYLDYSSHLRDAVINPLLKDKADGIDKSLQVLESYHLLREDLDSLLELSLWPGQRNPMILIDPKVKAAMTRAYNKKAPALPYAPGNIKKSRAQNTDNDNGDDCNDDEEDQEADSDPEDDALIKKKKVKEEKASSSKGKEKAGTSKEKPSSSKSKKK